MHIASIGIDLGKTTFHLVALGERNKILLRRKFSRSQLLAYTANLPASLIGLEACTGSHFMGTALREQGHQVRLIPAQFVNPYRKSKPQPIQQPAQALAQVLLDIFNNCGEVFAQVNRLRRKLDEGQFH
jgi:transposase